jgi:hypothetical protein
MLTKASSNYQKVDVLTLISGFRIESYSCKMIGTEKQLYKKLNSSDGRSPHTRVALSPPQNGYGGYGVSPQMYSR